MFFFSSRRRHTRYWRDWSSDVCSSDLGRRVERERRPGDGSGSERADVGPAAGVLEPADVPGQGEAVGGELEGPQHRLGRLRSERASCRERVEISVVAGSLKKK